MTKLDDGGPAFPLPDLSSIGMDRSEKMDGMTLRDWFAGQALAGIIANPHNERQVTRLQMAQDAYTFADAMLTARKKGPSDDN